MREPTMQRPRRARNPRRTPISADLRDAPQRRRHWMRYGRTMNVDPRGIEELARLRLGLPARVGTIVPALARTLHVPDRMRLPIERLCRLSADHSALAAAHPVQ